MTTQFDLTFALSDAIDLIDPIIGDHHKHVAYIAYAIGTELGLDLDQRNELIIAGALHDIAVLSEKERRELLGFESFPTIHQHAELGYGLLRTFQPFSNVASLVRFHHVLWGDGIGSEFKGQQVPIGSHILHLADRIDVLIDRQRDVLALRDSISKTIVAYSPKMFMPQLCDIACKLFARESFWLDVVSPTIRSILIRQANAKSVELDYGNCLALAKLFARIIDFRSRFTVTHSSGVAATAKALAQRVGMSESECQTIEIAGYLHDLGKLVVPVEILEKTAKLTDDELNIIKRHAYYSFRILETIPGFDVITQWASHHHERLDEQGYPFKPSGKALTLGSRIIAVADVFTALAEDRIYRKALTSEESLQVLEEMAGSALSPYLVAILREHYDEINSIRIAAQTATLQEYQEWGQADN